MTQRISIRQAISSDITDLVALDHDYSTDHVWQMALNRSSDEISLTFRQVRLPRPMRVHYPRAPQRLADEWTRRAAVLVGEADGERLAYLSLVPAPADNSGWISDLVVSSKHRRQGIATAMIGMARRWCRERRYDSLFAEMQSKNFPAINLARKLGFSFAGYSDQYYPDQDIALFFRLSIRERPEG
ncbi:MAG: GNAT family N-acetyltransferase [Anaerolineales bacterium]|nr:GNAT family N-acetyltransferase [Anaerolineales bacterium]